MLSLVSLRAPLQIGRVNVTARSRTTKNLFPTHADKEILRLRAPQNDTAREVPLEAETEN